MAVDTAALKQKAMDMAGRFTLGQKVLMVGVTLAVVVGVLMLSRSASSQDMAALYTNLKPEDAAAVTEKLSAQGATYALADSGSTVMVDRSKMYDLRLKLASEGLPRSGPEGYSLLDKQGITTSEFAQQVGYQRAMEGELAKTIQAMDSIEIATVHLAIPKDNVFVASDRKASASVLVKTKQGKEIDPMQVQAIVHLVASSIHGLDPNDVTVADSTGQVLAAPGKNGSTAGGSDLNGRQRGTFEKNMASSIVSFLEPVVGPGKAKVTVNADLDFDEKQATSETFQQPSGNPDRQTPAQQTTKTEEYQGTGGNGNAGVLGPDGGAVAGGGGQTSYNLTENQQTMALNRVVETRTSPPGTVKRLSVAVMVDSATTTPEQLQQLGNLVGAAAGIDNRRGDRIEVSRLQFDTSTADQQKAELAAIEDLRSREMTFGLIRQGVVALLVFGALLLVYRTVRRATARTQPTDLYAGDVREIVRPVEALPVAEPILMAKPEHEPVPVAAAPQRSEKQMHREEVQSRVGEMIDNQPVEVAQMLREWLGDRNKR